MAQTLDRIYTSHNWQPNQRKWLERLAKQLVFEVIVDREFVNTCFAEHGGAKRLDSVLDKQLDTVLEELSEALWSGNLFWIRSSPASLSKDIPTLEDIRNRVRNSGLL